MNETLPKITINKLGEYLSATPSRRGRIVKDHKYPSDFVKIWYTDARTAIVDYLSNGMTDNSGIMAKIEEFETELPQHELDGYNQSVSADALENFLDVCGDIDVGGYIVEAGDTFAEKYLEVAGVAVSMRPDAIIKHNETGHVVGAVKLHFSKSAPLGEVGCEYVATAMRMHLEEVSPSKNSIDPGKCYAVDVSTKTVKCAPKAYKRRMNDITAACEEIKARWAII